jgi:hypothetical protein
MAAILPSPTLWPQSNLRLIPHRNPHGQYGAGVAHPIRWISTKRRHFLVELCSQLETKKVSDFKAEEPGDGAPDPFGPFPTAIMSSSAAEIRPAAAEGPF